MGFNAIMLLVALATADATWAAPAPAAAGMPRMPVARPRLTHRVRRTRPSFAAAALYARGPGDVRLIRQLGMTASERSRALVELGASTAFWDTKARSRAYALRTDQAQWLPVLVPFPPKGSLAIAPALDFKIGGERPRELDRAGDARDLLRNEYVATALALGDTRAAWNAYGPVWERARFTELPLFEDEDFKDVTPERLPWLDHEVADLERLKAAGCDTSDRGGAYAYPVYLDIDSRLERAALEVWNAVLDHFEAYARREKLALTRDDLAGIFRISSGYRNPARNRCVGGDPFSRHQWGLALDLSFQPTSRSAASAAERLHLDIGTLWRRYRDVAALALSSNPRAPVHCKEGRLRAGPNARSKFSGFQVFCGCEGGGAFLNCDSDALAVDHVHVGF